MACDNDSSADWIVRRGDHWRCDESNLQSLGTRSHSFRFSLSVFVFFVTLAPYLFSVCVGSRDVAFSDADIVNIIIAIGTPTYQVDGLEKITRSCGLLTTQAAVEICRAIRTDTYIVDAIGHMRDKLQLQEGDVCKILSTIHADTYVVDAIQKLGKKKIAFSELCGILKCISADTYKVDALAFFSSQLDSAEQLTAILNCIHADTYKYDACKKLRIQPRSLNAAKIISCMQRISDAYRFDILQLLIPSINGDHPEALLDCLEESDVAGRKKLLGLLLRHFARDPNKNTHDLLQALFDSASVAENKARVEAGHSILINGFRVDVAHFPLNTELTVGLGSQTVKIIRPDEATLEVRGSSLEIEPVAHSGIQNLRVFGGSQAVLRGGVISGNVSICSVGGDLVVGPGAMANVSASFIAPVARAPEVQRPEVQRPVAVHCPPACPVVASTKSSTVVASATSSVKPKKSMLQSAMDLLVKSSSREDGKKDGKKESEASIEDKSCCVCLDAAPVGVFVPCGHKCCCMACGVQLQMCPFCRGKGQFLHVSLVSSEQRVFI
jgi:hypothetical protein